MTPPFVPARIQTVRIRSLARADIARLNSLPLHPIHARALETLHRYQDEGRIMLARETATDALRGYLTYHRISDSRVMVDYLYSPWAGQGTATQLMDRFELAHAGMTAVLMTTVAALKFYQRRGYVVDESYMFYKRL